MRTGLRLAALALLLLTLGVWLATGAHTGWTQTEVTEMRVDPVTELEYPETQRRFVAGVEVLGGGLLLSTLLFAGSFLVRPRESRSGGVPPHPTLSPDGREGGQAIEAHDSVQDVTDVTRTTNLNQKGKSSC